MTIRRFEAPSMPEALRQIRTELGEEAVILETRRIQGGSRAPGGSQRVQVLAAIDPPNRAGVRDYDGIGVSAGRELAGHAELRAPHSGRPAPRAPALRRERLAAQFRESGVQDALTTTILDACEPDLSDSALAAELMRRLVVSPTLPRSRGPLAGSSGCARVALVGPTGVGKTTTTAKLAAHFALAERRRVALLTIDTYRIGAVEQLRVYAQVMGLPFDVVESPDEMAAAVARHADKDMVLIDTVGLSPRKSLRLSETREILAAAQPTETHLVLASPYDFSYLVVAAEQFAGLCPNRLLITKLDELPRWGAISSLCSHTGLPVSWITDGQEVPRNLRPADAGEIALQILGGVQ